MNREAARFHGSRKFFVTDGVHVDDVILRIVREMVVLRFVDAAFGHRNGDRVGEMCRVSLRRPHRAGASENAVRVGLRRSRLGRGVHIRTATAALRRRRSRASLAETNRKSAIPGTSETAKATSWTM